jgi:hypothetical protein
MFRNKQIRVYHEDKVNCSRDAVPDLAAATIFVEHELKRQMCKKVGHKIVVDCIADLDYSALVIFPTYSPALLVNSLLNT